MQNVQIKIGPVLFDHHPDFRGEVEIRKGNATLKMPVETLRTFVAETVRNELMVELSKAKPADLLRREI